MSDTTLADPQDDFGECLAMDNTFLSEQQTLTFPHYHDDHDFDFSIDELLNLDPFDPTHFSTPPDPDPSLLSASQEESNASNKATTGLEEGSNTNSNTSVTSSPISHNNAISLGRLLKRKKGSEDFSDSNCKHFKSGDDVDVTPEEEEKRKARLERNRESAQLSRQRRKHYVEELEDKVRIMHSTIQDLNAKISYVIAENASLKQQVGGGVVQSKVAAQQPGMYPPPPMVYPWMHAPPYMMMKPQGSQVPLVPIPRLKSRQLAPAPKASRKTENKKSEGRTKKVASVSFVGLLFFMLLFGGLVPMVNLRYGGKKDSLISFIGRSVLVGGGHYGNHHGRVFTVNGSGYGEKFSKAPDINCKFNCAPRDQGGGEPSANYGRYESVGSGNGSEPLMASLYVPRNDKLVKIDGNLIIHSILASEKATTRSEDQQEKKNGETGLAILGDLVPSDLRRNAERRRRLALRSGVESENLKATAADRQLQQWFREGLAGPMLSSGRCTEVFQFDVVSASTPGSVVSATSASNVSRANSKTSTRVSKGRNRRILHGLPIPLPGSSAHNVSEESTGRETGNGSFPGTNSSSSMVVSVLMDPREAGDAEGDGMMGPKSLSKIFVVVLIDGVKYVTYSCMFPFKGVAVPNLVTA